MPPLPNTIWPELALLGTFLAFSCWEYLVPNVTYEKNRPWFYRLFWLQIGGVVLTTIIGWLITDAYQHYSLIPLLKAYFANSSPVFNGFIAYLLVTLINYWWHRLRHHNDLLWRLFHQIHHSTHRLQTVTALYAHPLDYASTMFIINLVAYALLGLNPESAAWAAAWVGIFELWEHTNIRTPRWLGYMIVRPEMHRVHHELDHHQKNYALPIWDMLFDTYENSYRQVSCGFRENHESRVVEMLRFKDVHQRPQ